MSLSLRDVLIASGCPRCFGAAVTDLGCTNSASSVLHSSSPLWEHRLLSSRSFIAHLSFQVHCCAATPNLHSVLSIREVHSQPGTVRVQEVSSDPAARRSQSSGCRTRSRPEVSPLLLDSGLQNGWRSCERETPDRFVSIPFPADVEIVMGGDFNSGLDHLVDRAGGGGKPDAGAAELRRILEQRGLVDAGYYNMPAWNGERPRAEYATQHHTHFYLTAGGQHGSSRIDRFYIARGLKSLLRGGDGGSALQNGSPSCSPRVAFSEGCNSGQTASKMVSCSSVRARSDAEPHRASDRGSSRRTQDHFGEELTSGVGQI
jgi:hypothetical protein